MATINNLFSATQYSYLFNSNNSASNNKQTAAQKSINSLWSSYSSNASSSMNALAGLSEIKSGVASVMASYDEAKETFYSEFDDAMSSLSKSAKAVKDYDFNVGENAITTSTSTDEDGKKITTTNYSDKMKDALDTVKGFVKDYNNSIKFLNDNSSVSSRVSQMAKNFSDATYRSADYSSIGINVKSDGTLEVDEEKLANQIVNNSSKVSRLVGSDGLAAKAESHVNSANGQRDRVFPSAKDMLGDQLSAASLYTGGTYAKMTSITNIGNLVNMMF